MAAFQKGQSGNPSGRPKITLPDGRSLKDVAREHTVKAIQTLVDVMEDEKAPSASRIAAASALIDRGWGRPTQPISGDDEAPPIRVENAPAEVIDWLRKQPLPEDAESA